VRRLPTLLALLGCLINALVLPLHAATHAPSNALDAALAADLAIICHGDPAAAAGDPANTPLPAPQAPADPGNDCPICKGIISFQLAILAVAEIGLLEPAITAVVFPRVDDRLSPSSPIAPRNRSPPLFV
jgi:hypothetical protein